MKLENPLGGVGLFNMIHIKEIHSYSQKGNMSTLSAHVASVHEGKKPFKCNICDYSSSLKHHMKKHVDSVHEGKKPFKCDICDYTCSQKSNMKRHVASVHEEKNPIKCDFCNFGCFLTQQMKQHVAKTNNHLQPSYLFNSTMPWVKFR